MHRAVLVADLLPARSGRGFVLDCRDPALRIATLRFSRTRHSELMVFDGAHHLRLCVRSGATGSSGDKRSFRLRVEISGIADLAAQLETIGCLAHLARHEQWQAAIPPSPRIARWVAMLRAHDARQTGATHYQIAAALFGEEVTRDAWKGGSDFLRTRVRRLIREADELIAGGYRRLLR